MWTCGVIKLGGTMKCCSIDDCFRGGARAHLARRQTSSQLNCFLLTRSNQLKKTGICMVSTSLNPDRHSGMDGDVLRSIKSSTCEFPPIRSTSLNRARRLDYFSLLMSQHGGRKERVWNKASCTNEQGFCLDLLMRWTCHVLMIVSTWHFIILQLYLTLIQLAGEFWMINYDNVNVTDKTGNGRVAL